MKYISWNVNGIRSVLSKNVFLEYLTSESPDVISLQEVKCTEEEFPARLEVEALGYDIVWNSAEKKGYAGTAVFTRREPLSVVCNPDGFGNEGRIITIEFPDIFFVNVYTPNAKRELERLDYRQEWDRDFRAYLLSLDATKPVILVGDLNVAHEAIDLANPTTNHRNAGFTDEERMGIHTLLASGFVDTFRHLHTDTVGAYTWWSNFARSRERNIGWRIDYAIVSDRLIPRVSDTLIRSDVIGSDHCPVGLILTNA